MKYKYILITILLYINCNKPHPISGRIIEFTHTGITTKIITPLFISTQKINISLNKGQLNDLKHFIGDSIKTTKQKEEEYINLKFDRLVTDSITFRAVYEFVFNNKDYYTNESHQNNNPSAESYNIHINGIKFSIYYKLKDDFFKNIKIYLSKKKCDKRVITALSHL